MPSARVVLIGGTSSVGKSTLARSLAGKWGWSELSTDRLGRHPGRPWIPDQSPLPEHVADHYRRLSVPELVTELLRHYERMWPRIEEIVTARAADPASEPLVLEGSGVWPERVAGLDLPGVAAIWLTAEPEVIAARIRAMSRFDELPAPRRVMVEKFIGRTLGYDRLMREAASRLGLPCVTAAEVESACLSHGQVQAWPASISGIMRKVASDRSPNS